MPSAPSSIFSRILFLLSGAVVIGMAAWFIQTSLAPVPAPPFVPPRKSVSFDANLDVSKNETFFRLRPLGPMVNTQPQMLGRANPFDPAPPPAPTTTSTTSTIPSNETATSGTETAQTSPLTSPLIPTQTSTPVEQPSPATP